MAEIAYSWLGLVFLGVVTVLILVSSVLRERRIGSEGAVTQAGTAQLLVWLGISFAVVAMFITVLLRFDAVV